MDFLELARARYSCRKLTNAPVAAEKLERILEAARVAPTAKKLTALPPVLTGEPGGGGKGP